MSESTESKRREAALGARRDTRLDVVIQRLLVMAAAATAVAAEHGFRQPPLPSWLTSFGAAGLFLLFAADYWFGPKTGRIAFRDQPRSKPQTALIIGGLAGMVFGSKYSLLPGSWFLFELSVALLCTITMWQLNIVLARRLNRPGLLLPLSFLSMIVVGTLLLKLPLAIAPGRELSWLDATFTMTSAVCVTGLIVVDTAQHFTPFGQFIIGLFMQLGGLGIIIFGTMLALLLGQKLSLRENLSLSSMLNDQPIRWIQSMVKFIVLTALAVELIAAALMTPLWPDAGLTLTERFGHALFHAVSAFCNAGFALQTDSFIGYRYSFMVHGIMAPLIVVGGVGFPVLFNMAQAVRTRWAARTQRHRLQAGVAQIDTRIARLTLHTKLVLAATVALYVLGFAGVFAGQWFEATQPRAQTMHQTPREPMTASRVGRMALDASFQSVTARTAGFNTMPMDDISPAGQFTLMSLMIVGASPGGTGGGMKTTTLALLSLSVIANMRRRQSAEAFGRQISDAMIRRAGTLALCYVGLVFVATFLLSISDSNIQLRKLLFEVISAASTTGLSLGITDGLTAFGKKVIIATMFLGRVGPLALIGAMAFRPFKRQPYGYATENVMLG